MRGFFKEHTAETKAKISAANTGKKPWNKGLKGFGKWAKNFTKGSEHASWKGQNVGYRGLHKWVELVLGKPGICESCRKEGKGHGMHWANISGQYLRKVEDWVRLCPKCHSDFDKNRI